MEYYEISVPDKNDSVMRVNLDGTYYYLRTTWCESGSCWLLSVYDAEMELIIGMTRLCPGAIWNLYYVNSGGPQGALGVMSDSEDVGRDAFVDGTAHLVYVPLSQIE